MTNKELGAIGEELAANYLVKSGYRLLHRNWRLKGGCEIDIVAFKDNALHFVEVKTRTTTFLDPLKAVNTETDPDQVKPAKGRNGKMDGGKYAVKLPALSWNVIRLG